MNGYRYKARFTSTSPPVRICLRQPLIQSMICYAAISSQRSLPGEVAPLFWADWDCFSPSYGNCRPGYGPKWEVNLEKSQARQRDSCGGQLQSLGLNTNP